MYLQVNQEEIEIYYVFVLSNGLGFCLRYQKLFIKQELKDN